MCDERAFSAVSMRPWTGHVEEQRLCVWEAWTECVKGGPGLRIGEVDCVGEGSMDCVVWAGRGI